MIAAAMCALMLGGAANAPAEQVRGVPIIMYHSVCRTRNNDYVLTPEKLSADIDYLHSRGYTTVFVRELADFCEGKCDLPKRCAVLSFDDGFYNNLSYALPIMREKGCKFTVCVVGAYSQKENGEKTRSPVYSYLSADNLRTLAESGICEIANHTFDMHTCKARRGVQRKKSESEQDYKTALTDDSERNRNYIKNACGVYTDVFAYPFGYYSASTPKILKKLGYRTILTCEQGINRISRGDTARLLALKRYNRPNKYTTEYFFEKVVKLPA